MPAQDDMREAMLAAVPNLRAFAVSLCGDMDRANDLVQETLLRAWAHQDSFEPGTNMSAWLFTILRNHFRTEYRKRRREVEDADGGYAERLTSPEAQTGHVEFGELREALLHLPPDQREALILVGASGFSYGRPPGSASVPSARSRAGSIAQERNLPSFSRSSWNTRPKSSMNS